MKRNFAKLLKYVNFVLFDSSLCLVRFDSSYIVHRVYKLNRFIENTALQHTSSRRSNSSELIVPNKFCLFTSLRCFFSFLRRSFSRSDFSRSRSLPLLALTPFFIKLNMLFWLKRPPRRQFDFFFVEKLRVQVFLFLLLVDIVIILIFPQPMRDITPRMEFRISSFESHFTYTHTLTGSYTWKS